jgi:hypothetical protein
VKGEQHRTKKEIIEMLNSKAIYKENNVQVYERSLRRYVSEGIIALSPPRKGVLAKFLQWHVKL